MAKRAIFEEVDQAERPAAKGGVIDAARRGSRWAARAWLIVLFALVVVMIAVGGLTRLTDSGLSITEWRPVSGALPPMSDEAWEAEFELYRAIPEYELQNKGMSLSEFKVIYWWEWGHRQLGRVIGLVWALGFAWLLLSKKMPVGWTGRFALLGALGGLQGAIGWWMVSSGLTGTMLDVASYRLATHLGLAFVILSLIAWYVLSMSRPEAALLQARRDRDAALMRWGSVLIGFSLFQIVWGALVAGIDAGLWVRDWPTMHGGVFPVGMWEMEPLLRNVIDNPGTVQWFHRIWGYLLAVVIVAAWWRARRSAYRATRAAFLWLIPAVFVQMVLGIVTVLEGVPIQWAILHQFGAVVLICLAVRARHRAKYPLSQSVRA
ncbi:heme A synthase [Jannaschia seohaensis]|uniref:Heme A synthase n=1 Tax=Jannaschia seohaensis TaxID=475081 RepID=A0A2Y9C5F8_9RHOB|nr:heme A synthase [Jannaschia seohaensis]PWJ20833.1 cytochrome c oxidase assembly protein subunit 15 [Jannaschia seohaensis]SSA41243.1 cytochrome c oxidase assembly protein subunit 15 [Jannaschia seohaensis]